MSRWRLLVIAAALPLVSASVGQGSPNNTVSVAPEPAQLAVRVPDCAVAEAALDELLVDPAQPSHVRRCAQVRARAHHGKRASAKRPVHVPIARVLATRWSGVTTLHAEPGRGMGCGTEFTLAVREGENRILLRLRATPPRPLSKGWAYTCELRVPMLVLFGPLGRRTVIDNYDGSRIDVDGPHSLDPNWTSEPADECPRVRIDADRTLTCVG